MLFGWERSGVVGESGTNVIRLALAPSVLVLNALYWLLRSHAV